MTANAKAVKGSPPKLPVTKESEPDKSLDGESKPASPMHIIRDKLSAASPNKDAGEALDSPQLAAAKPVLINKEDSGGLLMGDDTRSSHLVTLAEPTLRRPVPT
ncbi:hypothetical protein ACO0LG_23780 [Undibacterium sp. Ji42W]|uniref:hypothetical protein n=1 Tax=Undibacterium sp. Ji42W TaxID=3413039 RepID=UPI003BEF8B60